MAFIRLQYEPIDVLACYQKMKAPAFGGIVTFCGTVREWTEELQTTFIEYTAYEEMAVKELRKLAAPIEAAGGKVVIVHRLGPLEIEDEAVFIGVATAHRQEAFEGCRQIIDQLKEAVPIWKKEINTTGERWGGELAHD